MSSFFNSLIGWCERQIIRCPWTLLLLAIAFCGLTLDYTVKNLEINTNTTDMLSADLPFRQNLAHLNRTFPEDADTIIFVVEAKTPEETAQAAGKLAEQLGKANDRFSSVYIPTDNAFFRQQALLYLEQNELDELAQKLTDAQPFLGHLSQNYHLEGLFGIIGQALEQRDNTLPMDLEPILVAIDDTLNSQLTGQPHYLSWQNILAEDKPNTKDYQDAAAQIKLNRTIVIAKPKMHFDEMLPADVALSTAREISRGIMAENPTLSIRITGETALEHEELESVTKDAAFSGLLSLVLVCSVLWIGLRSVKLVLITYLVLIMGLILTAGFAAITVGHLNVISMAFASLYIGLGVDYAIHICLHYREGRAEGLSNSEAIVVSIRDVGSSLFLCALTTALGFFAFIPTDYAGVSELGIISGGGIFIGLIISLTVLPALFCIFPANRVKPLRSALIPAFAITFPFRHATGIKVVSILLGIGASFALTQLSFDYNPINLRDPSSESVSTIKELLKSKTESPFTLTALAKNLEAADNITRRLEQQSSVHDVITLTSFVAKDQDEKLATIEDLNLMLGGQLKNFDDTLDNADQLAALTKFNGTLKKAIAEQSPNAPLATLQQLQQRIDTFIKQAETTATPKDSYVQLEKNILGLLPFTIERLRTSLTAAPFGLDDLPPEITSHWVSSTGLYRILIAPEKDQNNPEHLKEFVTQVQAIDDSVSGLPIVNLAGGDAVVNAFIEAFSGAFIAIVLLLLLIYKNIRKTLLVIMPLLLAALLTGASNVLLNNPFNFANIIALPLLLGMGLDSSILIMHRHHSTSSEDEQLLQSSTTRGIIFGALTTLCCFSSLAFTAHRGIASMGLLLTIGLTFTVMCSLIVLPAFSGKRI
ncbi:MAG: MMPL family transporter [Methylobacter sp.]|nr:MMPL family transporter [Methylobacter sp.]MDP2428458.1 MMPL family transporter [Methylobacter sp.]MDP3053439.1 MMPL family transporter [Methylobacter sp.]MDP3361637.1 MMPL family transporter [Methylobacter sp.]MDZ4220716.1 MMPL family transporter [Methylobacter sp.]